MIAPPVDVVTVLELRERRSCPGNQLLEERQGRAVEITVRPEALPESHHYTVEWQYLVYDEKAMNWQPLAGRPDKDDRGG